MEVGREWRRERVGKHIGLNVRVERSREEVYVWEEGGCMCGRREGKREEVYVWEGEGKREGVCVGGGRGGGRERGRGMRGEYEGRKEGEV